MAAGSIRADQVFDFDGDAYRVIGLAEVGTWSVLRVRDSVVRAMPHTELLELYSRGALTLRVGDQRTPLSDTDLAYEDKPLVLTKRGKRILPELIRLPNGDLREPKQQARLELALALQKARLARVAAAHPHHSEAQREGLRDAWPGIFKDKPIEEMPNLSTLYRWGRKLEEANGDVRALLPAHHKKGRKRLEVNGALARLIEEVVDEHYLTPERNSINATYTRLKTRILAENSLCPDDPPLKPPPISRLREYIEGLNAFDKYAARYSYQAATKKFRSVLKNIHSSRPLDRVELDATKLDVVLLDDTGIPLGRPWLHVCLDVRTRCILGYYVSFEPPSLATLFETLRHAILPKLGGDLATLDVVNPWPFYGAFERLVLDNAFENHSSALDPLAALWGLEIQFCPRRCPWYKAKIERFIGTLNHQLFHSIPGTTFSNILEKGDYDPKRMAVMTWATFEKVLAQWINDVYHQRKHRSLDGSPASEWAKLVKSADILLPCNANEIRQLARIPVICRLTHKGIERHGLFWNSEELAEVRRRCGAELDVRVYFDHMNLGSVFVQHPDVPPLSVAGRSRVRG